MTNRTRRRAWLVALWGAAFGFGCSGQESTQVLTGRIDATGVVAIRAVSGEDVVTASKVEADGTFRLALPSGSRYRLEVLTSSGVKHVLSHESGSWKGLEFGVCVPSDPFDVGSIGDSGTMCDPMSDPNCKPCGDDPGQPPPPCNDPMDPNCMCKPDGTCPPPPCSDPMDPNCQPPPPPSCGGPNEPPCPECMDPTDPNCKPPDPCSTNPMDPNCQPPPDPECMDPTDPWCQCKADGTCPPPCNDPSDPNCMGGCMPGDPNCGTGPICEDPMDPDTCKDPCVIDPMNCGCSSNDPNCWPPPEPPECMAGGTCDPGGTMTPSKVPGDFGCMGFMGK
jgi:hypothetical protein